MTANTNPESIVNEPGPGFLGHLAPSIRCYPYRGREQFLFDFEVESRYASEWLLLSEVDNQTFTNEFLEPIDKTTPYTSWSSYDAHLQLLLVRTTKSPALETASLTFHKIFLEALEPTGLKRSLKEIGSTTHFAALGAKEPDQSWRSHQLPPGCSQDWPSVVLEVAYSEPKSKLASDVRFWAQALGDDVKVVLTLCVHRQQPEITIEKWVSNNNRYHIDQSVTVSKSADNRIMPSNAPLTIELDKLFLRPTSIPSERSIEVDAGKLQYLAGEIWDEQGF